MALLPRFSYTRPHTLAQATAALARRGARAYAGGTDLLVAMAEGHPSVGSIRVLVDIKGLVAAKGIVDQGASLRIGALTTAANLAASPLVQRHAPALAEAAEQTAAPALRHRATIGGNLVTPHSAGDPTTALLATGATVEWIGTDGRRRRMRVGDYVASSARRVRLILSVHVPKFRRSAFEKHGPRQGFSRSIVGVAVTLGSRGAVVAVGGVAERPIIAAHTAAALDAGTALTAALAADGVAAEDLDVLAVLVARAQRRADRR